MITILPAAEPDRSRRLDAMGLGSLEGAEILLMKERDAILGSAAVAIENSELILLRLSVEGALLTGLSPEQRFIADSLLRAAASYGANQGAWRLVSREEEAEAFLRAEGFQKEPSGRMVLPTAAIVKISKDSQGF